jgi:hypothetical protein
MTSLVLAQPAVFAYISAGLLILLGMVQLGHRVLDLLRDLRDFRDGR